MNGTFTAPRLHRAGPPRALVICAAVILGLAVWSAARMPAASAQEAKAPAGTPAPAVPPVPTPPPAPAAAADAAAASSDGASTSKSTTTVGSGDRSVTIEATIKTDAGKGDAKASLEADAGKRTVTIRKNGKTVTIQGDSDDPDVDSFDHMVETQPELFGMVIAVVAVVFFAPVVAIGLIVSYRMRKARLQNETLLKLAERGVVSTPEAMAALTGTAPLPAAMPVADAAREVRKRAAWSDLRKGVVMTAVGLAISVYTTARHGFPNVFGLIVLFLGLGYALLWWFEQRQAAASTPAMPAAGGPAERGSDG